ncbi:succinylglutamate desuccinylase/aspartoacylase family protein [Bosea sp. (in: a-proteobacteria)]|uniref:succinylglutamate desuccinylase/aspartoacylase family protein n=2 Tax=Bosea sp. (in: a-proteobacteria) TaxID=1871050 RepID=UPI00273738B8|nr:succinylglutamate desuccinylase/aspartoacylase family protein [Bosea sp. (in: a-proteobacteria)]MDP3406736.1 M14 family metallopeptidase [Bosea sp. (in: a-proteobacteria)]
MLTETIAIPAAAPGTAHHLTVQRFGRAGARPCVYIQAALHADEIPGMICAQALRRELLAIEAAGHLQGEVVLVPVANPLGLGQQVLGQPVGRFALGDGGNFNRDFPDLCVSLSRIGENLADAPQHNLAIIREGLAAALSEVPALTPAQHLKKTLMGIALGCDVVLDLHCDAEAAMHLYTHTASAEIFAPLAALLGARAILLAEVSGGDPFDEALSRPWFDLARAFPGQPVPFGCHSVTVELRGQRDVGHETATADAAAILAFLRHLGVIAGALPTLPPALCSATALEASEPLIAPFAGILVYRREVGEDVGAGDVVAEIVDPLTGETTPVAAASGGVFYARSALRFAVPGSRLGKIAGTRMTRSGRLLSP